MHTTLCNLYQRTGPKVSKNTWVTASLTDVDQKRDYPRRHFVEGPPWQRTSSLPLLRTWTKITCPPPSSLRKVSPRVAKQGLVVRQVLTEPKLQSLSNKVLQGITVACTVRNWYTVFTPVTSCMTWSTAGCSVPRDSHDRNDCHRWSLIFANYVNDTVK